MNKITWITASALLASTCLTISCSTQDDGEVVATRPSLTVYPIHMAGEDREDVAYVAAELLERSGIESIEVDSEAFAADFDSSFDDQAAAFAAFVKARDVSTEYALYGAVIGSPRGGVDEIRSILVDADGNVAWSDRQTRESPALKRAQPNDPMTSTVFLVERLRGPLDLHDPMRADAPRGKMAERGRVESLAPTDAQLEQMEQRLARLREAGAGATVIVYPARTGDAWSARCAEKLANEINRKGLLSASVAKDPIEFEIQPSRNQQKILWSGARSIQQLVRAHPPEADYVLVADYMVSERAGQAMAVHTFLLDAGGDWVIVDYQNDHHDDFNTISPTSLEECCDLSIVRIAGYLDA